MKIYIRQIGPNGLDLEDKISEDFIGLNDNDDLKFISPINYKAHVDRVEDEVLINIKVKGDYSSICARCIKDVAGSFERKINLDFSIDKKTEFIEIDEDLRQEVILALPVKVLCKEDCKGICPGCGEDLNRELCKCQVSPRLMEQSEHKS